MATPSLKKMDSGTQEGIYASLDTSHIDEVDSNDLGLTLLPGSQIQTEGDKQGHARADEVHCGEELLRELNNGSEKGVASRFGRSASCRAIHQDVCSQEKTGDRVEIEAEGNTGSKQDETTCAPCSSSTKTADGAGERARTEPHKASTSSNKPARSRSRYWNDLHVVQTCAYPVNVTVSSAVKGIDEKRENDPIHRFICGVEGESVVLDGEARSSENDAEGSLDRLRPYKRQKTEEYLPFSLFHDLQDDLVEQLDLGVDIWKCGSSDENVRVLSTEASGTLRSRSHSPANDVVGVVCGTGSEPHYQPPPRLISTLALKTRSRRLDTPRSSGISSGHTIGQSARPERSHTPLSTTPQASRVIATPALSPQNRATLRQSHEQSNFAAPSASIASLLVTPQTADSISGYSQPESALNEEFRIPERLPSATALPLHNHQEPTIFAEPSVTINSLSSLPTHHSNSAKALHTVSLSTISPAQSPFTESFDKCNNNSIHGTTSLDNTADSTTIRSNDLPLETALPYRVGPLPCQEAYESPYAPKSQRLQHLLGPQTEERIIIPNIGYHIPMEHSTLEPAVTVAAPAPPPGSKHPHSAPPIRSNTPSPRPIAQLRPAVRLKPSLSMPSPPEPNQSVSKTGSPNGVSSQEDSAESDETSNDSSSEESPAPTERIPIPPRLVNAAKKGVHAITSVIISRIHHADIVPRVISFIETFPSSSGPPASPHDSLAPPSDACPADHKDLLYKNHSIFLRNQDLLQRNTVIRKERDRFKRAAREWATLDHESGLTKGQSMSREVRSLRSQLANKTAEAERLRKAWMDFETSRSTSHQWNYTSSMLSGAPPRRASSNGREPRVDVIWPDTGGFSGVYQKRSFPAAEPTPPASNRVSVDLTEGTSEPLSRLATPGSAPLPPLPPSPAAAELRSTMKRKTYSWLPDKSNHMVQKPSPAARGSRPSTAIDLDVEGPAFDPEAELEAELERELLASQHAEEREQQRKRQRRQAVSQRRQKMTPKQKAAKDRRAKAAATTAARTSGVEEEPERLVVEKEQEQRRVRDEQRLREAEERARDEELFGVEDDQQRTEAEERARDEELFGMDEEEHEEMVDVQVGAEGGWDEAADLALLRAMEESTEESEAE